MTGDNNNQIHFEGYQVSNQCMALVRDDCLIPTKDVPELGYVKESSNEQYVPDVFYKVRFKVFQRENCVCVCVCVHGFSIYQWDFGKQHTSWYIIKITLGELKVKAKLEAFWLIWVTYRAIWSVMFAHQASHLVWQNIWCLHTFQLIRIKFDAVLKQFKFGILMLRLSEVYFILFPRSHLSHWGSPSEVYAVEGKNCHFLLTASKTSTLTCGRFTNPFPSNLIW